jgi:hypothetical protein
MKRLRRSGGAMSTFKRNTFRRTLLGFVVVAGLLVTAVAQAQAPPPANAPWYPSLQAFEHYDSGRSHVFSRARFGGSFNGSNRVDIVPSSEGTYPSGYNMSYLNHKAAFIQGGSYGDVEGSIGPFVAKVDPTTLKQVWYTQLRNTVEAGEWDYPGAMAIMNDGYIYVVSGYRIFKVEPADGHVVATLVLPTMVHMRNNYPDTPPTYNITLPAFAGARPTITRYHGVDYVYLLENTSNAVRYSVHNGFFTLDTSWTPAAVPYPGQTTGGSLIIMNDWVLGATNSIPAAGPLTVFAINQSDATKVFLLQPYVNDPIPPELSAAFATAASGGVPAISWAGMSLEADPENGLFYGVETLARKIASRSPSSARHSSPPTNSPGMPTGR